MEGGVDACSCKYGMVTILSEILWYKDKEKKLLKITRHLRLIKTESKSDVW